MAGGGLIHALGKHSLGEQTEFNFSVADDTGIRSPALAIRICERGNDSFPELLLHVHQMQGDIETISNLLYFVDLFLNAGQGELHKKTMYGKALLKQNRGGNSGVNAATHGNADSAGACFFSHSAVQL